MDPAMPEDGAEAGLEAEPSAGVSHAWRALRHRNFRLFFGGQTISLIGTWMTRVATGWLVYRLTGSALLLGTVSFAGQIPTFLLAPFAGVWVDRLDRRQVLVWTQTLSMVQSLALAALTLSGHITIPLAARFKRDAGLRQCLRYARPPVLHGQDGRRQARPAERHRHQLVDGQCGAPDRPVAGRNADRGQSSEGWCFLIDGISYIAVIASLLMMRLHAPVVKRAATSMLTELQAGWTYVAEFLPIRTILMLFAVISLMGMPFVVLMPIFAKKVLHGGPHTLGFLMGAMGLGALLSALSLAARRTCAGW
jgi:MFS family permease